MKKWVFGVLGGMCFSMLTVHSEWARLAVKEPEAAGDFVYYIVKTGESQIWASHPGGGEHDAAFDLQIDRIDNSDTQWRAVSLSGRAFPWRKAKVAWINRGAHAFAPVIDSDFVKSDDHSFSFESIWAQTYALQSIELPLRNPAGLRLNFDLFITVDGGVHWLPVPNASFRHFPDCGEVQLKLWLHGLNANGVRLQSHHREAGIEVGGIVLRGEANTLFEVTGESSERVAAWNNLYVNFGAAHTEVHDRFLSWWPSSRPFSGGMSILPNTEWAEWNQLQLSWTEHPMLSLFENNLKIMPQDPDGYVWVAPTEAKHLNHSRHPVATAVYIIGTVRHFMQTGDHAFLFEPEPSHEDAIIDKLEKAHRYLMETLSGQSGVAVISDPEHAGSAKHHGSNYWDAWKFGYKSAYLNLYVYRALKELALLHRYLKNEERASLLELEAEVVRTAFQDVFWNKKTGRFFGWFDAEENAYDFGFTFLNQQAVEAGIASPEQERQIMDWILGKRWVEGDCSKGADIYHFDIVARSNTLAAETMDPPPWGDFYGGFLAAGKGKSAEFGNTIQNGGGIFFTSYYDLHARLRAEGPDGAYELFEGIADGAVKDGLRRMPDTDFTIVFPVGIVREFSESGIVPIFMIDGFMGIRASYDGLRIAPQLPSSWQSARVGRYIYHGQTWDIEAVKNLDKPSVSPEVRGVRRVRVPAKSLYVLKADGSIVERR